MSALPLDSPLLHSPHLAFRNHQGELIDIELIAATQAKNQFGQMLEQAQRVGAVAIMRSGNRQPKAVLVSYEEFLSLVKSRAEPLSQLTAEFDSLLAHMQTPAARAGMRQAFEATPSQMGTAAVAVAVVAAAINAKVASKVIKKVPKKATTKTTKKTPLKLTKKPPARRPSA